MDSVPLWVQIVSLVTLTCTSAFFAISETALLALNRHRIKHLARRGSKLAQITLWLLDRTDRMLALILIGSTVVNSLITALMTSLAISAFGNDEKVITIATGIVAFLLIVFAEITPKVIGATYPERIALPASFIIKPLMIMAGPVIWFMNLFVRALLRVMRIRTGTDVRDQRLSPEELRSMVLEGGNFIPVKHKSILLNLFDLERVTVEDVMTPRAQIEALNLSVPVDEVKHQLTTCYHNKLLVHDGEINRIAGILHVRKAIALLNQVDELTVEHFRELLTEPYFIPPETDLFSQLQYFQENQERLAVIVDEYGEVQGLVTLDDIIEEMVGEFTTSTPGATRADQFGWDKQGACLLEGSISLRDVNKRLKLSLPLEGPKTLNGLLLEVLEEIPEASVSVKLAGCVIEIVQVQEQVIKMVKLYRPGR
jgi:Mg2+/Co2+ transporter CorB